MVILTGFYRLVYLFPRESRPSTNFIDARNTYLAPDHHSFERLVDSCRQAGKQDSEHVCTLTVPHRCPISGRSAVKRHARAGGCGGT